MLIRVFKLGNINKNVFFRRVISFKEFCYVFYGFILSFFGYLDRKFVEFGLGFFWECGLLGLGFEGLEYLCLG